MGTLSLIWEGITYDSRRSLIRSILPGLIEQGYSGKQSLEFFRNNGLGIRTTEFYELNREVLGIEIRSNRIQNVNIDLRPSDGVFEDLKYASPYKYRLVGEATVTKDETGEQYSFYFGWDADTTGTIRDITAEGFEKAKVTSPPLNGEITGFRIRKGFINPAFM